MPPDMVGDHRETSVQFEGQQNEGKHTQMIIESGSKQNRRKNTSSRGSLVL